MISWKNKASAVWHGWNTSAYSRRRLFQSCAHHTLQTGRWHRETKPVCTHYHNVCTFRHKNKSSAVLKAFYLTLIRAHCSLLKLKNSLIQAAGSITNQTALETNADLCQQMEVSMFVSQLGCWLQFTKMLQNVEVDHCKHLKLN